MARSKLIEGPADGVPVRAARPADDLIDRAAGAGHTRVCPPEGT